MRLEVLREQKQVSVHLKILHISTNPRWNLRYAAMAGYNEEGASMDQEFDLAELGDRRRVMRLMQLARALEEDPSASLPEATGTDAGLEGAYRLLNNEAVSAEGILAGHFKQTVERAAAQPWVIAVHDTTIFEFSGETTRKGLGPLRGKGQGFLAHLSLLVAPGEPRRPLGVLSLQTVVRKHRRGKQAQTAMRSSESRRWYSGVQKTEERLSGRSAAIHVMDREGDSYELWSELMSAGYRFVIRTSRDRSLTDSDLRLSDAILTATTVVERTIALSPRREEKIIFSRRRHPARAGRLARLALSAIQVQVRKPKSRNPISPDNLTLNVVHVREVETHGENEPVQWTLVTREPIETAADIERIVDIYRARWLIEEYFKAIKTGCAYEKRQLESIHSLLNALAVFIPIAWRLLLLRTLAREAPDAPASEALTSTQLEVLVATSRKPMPKNPTVRQALLAVAALGGHIKNNGEPGWLVLGRGYQKLLVLEQGWTAAQASRSDQS